MKEKITAGLFIRKEMRSILMRLDIDFKENKAFTFSEFWVTKEDCKRVADYMKANNISVVG